jgi:hypothetical protein
LHFHFIAFILERRWAISGIFAYLITAPYVASKKTADIFFWPFLRNGISRLTRNKKQLQKNNSIAKAINGQMPLAPGIGKSSI